jgi:hypothetical protein
MRNQILPAVIAVYGATHAEVDRANDGATRNWPLALTAAAFLVALAGMVRLQQRLNRRFHRTVNPPMLLATVLVVVAFAWVMTAWVIQGRAVDRARREGSDPITTLTQARVDAQQLRADDELTLVTRDTDPLYQDDYNVTAQRLDQELSAIPAGDLAAVRAGAGGIYEDVRKVHQNIRTADDGGHPAEAIGIVTGDVAAAESQPVLADSLDQVLAGGVADRDAHFRTVAASAVDDLRGLVLGLIAIGVAAVALVRAGVSRRLAEYGWVTE